MKKIILLVFTVLLALGGRATAQESEPKLTKEEKKALQAQLDSLLYCEAEQAVNDRKFTLEADEVTFKYGQRAYVNSNTNFVSVDGNKAVVQVAFNIPVSGPNGLGGVTVDGTVSGYEVKKDKRGNINISMNVVGIGISAQVFISLHAGGNSASVDISPNFNSNRLSLSGSMLPLQKSSVFKGRSL